MVDVTGIGKFKTTFDTARDSVSDRISDIDRREFDDLKKLFLETKGRLSFTDGQADALAYVATKDPALAATLRDHGTYDDYRTALYARMDKRERLPTDWRAEARSAAPVGYQALPEPIKEKVINLRKTVDLAIGSTVTQKVGVMQGLQHTDEWRELEQLLKPYRVSVPEVLGQSRSAR